METTIMGYIGVIGYIIRVELRCPCMTVVLMLRRPLSIMGSVEMFG